MCVFVTKNNYRQVPLFVKVQLLLNSKLKLDWDEDLFIRVESNDNDLSATTITVTVDQAALQGLLRRLYSLGLPLISVICTELD